jgi:hypothetical protein
MAHNGTSNILCGPLQHHREPPNLAPPKRNHFFFGKLMDVRQFQLETQYGNAKRWLLNRLVSGYGVVCGLGVELNDDGQVIVHRGLAIDKWGREIIVPEDTPPLSIPEDILPPAPAPVAAEDPKKPGKPPRGQPGRAGREPSRFYIRVWLGYRECLVDPAPVMVGDCCEAASCEPGAVQEGYCIYFERHDDPHHGFECRCENPEFIRPDGSINYDAVVDFVSRKCPDTKPNSRILLAQIEVWDGRCDPQRCDIHVRRVVFTNRLLYELIQASLNHWQDRWTGEESGREEEEE